MNSVTVGVTWPSYNREAPFHPDTHYPELPFTETSKEPNWAYALLRELFRCLDYDSEAYGTASWNPLGGMIRPGQTVLIKPNFVLDHNAEHRDLFAMITHPSLLRALVDYTYIALAGEGRIIIADAPQMDCDWEALVQAEQLTAIRDFYLSRFKFNLEVYDLRNFAVIDPTQMPLSQNRKTLKGDPEGSIIINLGRKSHFYGLNNQNYYGADYNRQETLAHHQGETQEYSVSKTVLGADVFLSVPKMKTHKKVGVTLNLKGLVGINTNKNYLVHYRLGRPEEGGDQFPNTIAGTDRTLVKAQRWAYDHLLGRQSKTGDAIYRGTRAVYRAALKPFLRVSKGTYVLDAGNWHGNDSAWRMTADLVKILYFADREGCLQETPQRRVFCLVDGIVGGEGFGPLEPDPHRAGCLVAGVNPVAVDLVATRLMGFNPRKLRQFDIAFDKDWDFGLRSLGDIEVRTPSMFLPGESFFAADNHEPYFGFAPHPGWKGHIEA